MKLTNVGIANLCVSNKIKSSYFNNDLINESKESASDFLKTVTNSPILSLEFKVFNNIENKVIDNDLAATRYIDNNIKLFETFTIDEINTEHAKLEKFINENVDADDYKVKLYNSIAELITESISDYESIDVDKIHESFTLVLNHIKKEKKVTKLVEEIISNDINEDIIEIAIDKFNEKYQDLLEEDKNLIKKLINYNFNEKKNLFEEIKIEAINCFSKLDSEKYGNKIDLATDKINNMMINESEIDDNIIQLYELKKSLL